MYKFSSIRILIYLLITGNQLYSCGCAEDGRLGINLPPSEKTVNNGWAHPRPIFGSLHHVTSISCSHWHTIVVAG